MEDFFYNEPFRINIVYLNGGDYIQYTKAYRLINNKDGKGYQLATIRMPILSPTEAKMWAYLTDNYLTNSISLDMSSFPTRQWIRHQFRKIQFDVIEGGKIVKKGLLPSELRYLRMYNLLKNYNLDPIYVQKLLNLKDPLMLYYYKDIVDYIKGLDLNSKLSSFNRGIRALPIG